MRTLAATLFATALSVVLTPPFLLPRADGAWIIRKVSAAAPSYAFEETFSGSQSGPGGSFYDNTGWNSDGTVGNISNGTDGTGTYVQLNTAVRIRTQNFSGNPDNWYVQFKIDGEHTFENVFQATQDYTLGAAMRLASSGNLDAWDGATGGADYSYSTGTVYHAWLEHTAGTGSNGQVDLYVATTATKPGAVSSQVTGSGTTAVIDRFLAGKNIGTLNMTLYRVIGDTSPIGSNP